jgi:hypothetical protein
MGITQTSNQTARMRAKEEVDLEKTLRIRRLQKGRKPV